MPNSILILLITQLLFTMGDLIARHYMARFGFVWNNFLSVWFLSYVVIRTIATFCQLYLFTQFDLGKNMALFGAVSIVLANGLGYLLLGEVLTPAQYIGVALAMTAFLVLALMK